MDDWRRSKFFCGCWSQSREEELCGYEEEEDDGEYQGGNFVALALSHIQPLIVGSRGNEVCELDPLHQLGGRCEHNCCKRQYKEEEKSKRVHLMWLVLFLGKVYGEAHYAQYYSYQEQNKCHESIEVATLALAQSPEGGR